MALPKYDLSKTKQHFETLPKGAYVVKILSAKKENIWGKDCIHFGFDIAEGEYAGFYMKQYNANTNEDKKWPFVATYDLEIPGMDSDTKIEERYNEFFRILRDSNDGFLFDCEKEDYKTFRGKIFGGLFAIRQSRKGYKNMRLIWPREADDIRNGTYGNLPYDQLNYSSETEGEDSDGYNFMKIDAIADEIPF